MQSIKWEKKEEQTIETRNVWRRKNEKIEGKKIKNKYMKNDNENKPFENRGARTQHAEKHWK